MRLSCRQTASPFEIYIGAQLLSLHTEDMTSDPETLVLEHLRPTRKKVDVGREDLHDLMIRLTHIEETLAMANRRLDRVESRLEPHAPQSCQRRSLYRGPTSASASS